MMLFWLFKLLKNFFKCFLVLRILCENRFFSFDVFFVILSEVMELFFSDKSIFKLMVFFMCSVV